MATSSVASVAFDLVLNSSKFKSGIKSSAKEADNTFSAAMNKVKGYIAGAFSVVAITKFTKASVDAASQMQSAWTGLKSIADGSGKSFAEAQKFINEYTKDGLITINEAATAYKNLLSRGYDTTQIQNTMNALKDSAAFGRQASYELGEAVVSATEGLKNENSILVDNAGVTKNVAKMWEDWAKAHNTTTAAMTQAQKIEAEYNGILQETSFQTGDAATYTRTFGGQVQMLKASFTNLKIAVGSVIAPIAGLFIPVLNSALVAVTNFFNGIKQVLSVFGLEFPTVVAKSSTGIANLGQNAVNTAGDIASTGSAAKKAAKEVNKAFAGVDEINVLNTKDTSSSGSGGGGSAGGADVGITPTIASDSAVTSAISGTMEKIMKFIEPLKNIKFDNLINAFSNLKSAVEPIVNTVGQALEWLYFNILVPFAKWTIEDAVPAFLNAIAGALRVLQPVIDGAKEGLIWLWDSFLKPIASWTGGVIVDVLNGIGDALDWVSKNETAVFILESLGMAIGVVVGAIAALNVAMAILNGLGAIASVIFSPVTLIVLAIVAAIALLVAGIRLLIEHWDDIKAAALNAWDNIKAVWSTVANWFNDNVITPVKNFFSPIVSWFSQLFGSVWQTISDIWFNIVGIFKGVVESIKIIFGVVYGWFNEKVFTPLKTAFNVLFTPLKEGAQKAWDGIKTIFSTVASFFKDTFTKAWTAVKAVFSVGGKIFDGIKDGIVNAFKTIVNAIIGGINKVISVPFNGINTALKKIKNIDILGSKPFSGLIKTISIPSIPMLAEGGWFPKNSPRLAIVGDNTREGEITTPESKIYEQVSKALRDNNGAGTKELAITIYHKYEDGKTIIQKVNQAQIDAGEILLLT